MERFDIQAKATGQAAGEIMVYGYIADSKWDDDDVTAKDFDSALKELGNIKDLHIRVNSYGGSVFAGQAIVSMIDGARAKGVKVTATIEGIGASMGSVIPQAADKLIMASNAMLMIHKPSAVAWGNADDMMDTAEMLDKAESQLIALYMRRFKGTEDELKDMLRGTVDGTWLTADEALELGLCDEVAEPVEMAACAKGYRMNGITVPADVLKGATDKIQIFEKDGGEKEMLFDKETDAKIKALLDEGKAVAVEQSEDGYVVKEVLDGTLEPAGDFLTAEQVTAIAEFGLDGVDDMIAQLKDLQAALDEANAEPDPELVGKAEKYNQIVEDARKEALANGVRAKGEGFDSARYEKMLDSLTYDEVLAQSAEWQTEADEALNAGAKRRSFTPNDRKGNPVATANPADYEV